MADQLPPLTAYSEGGCLPGSLCHFLVFTICPLLGNVFAVALFAAPLPRVLAARNSGRLDGLNTLPYPLIVGNTAAWLLYGLYLRDSFLVFPNMAGFLLGLSYILSTLPLQAPTARTITTNVLLVSCLWVFCGAEVAFVIKGPEEGRVWMGGCATVVLLCFFASPLSSMFEVIRTRDSSSIHFPLAVASVFNGGFWSIYGLFLGDPFVLYPNLFGLLSSIVQLGLYYGYPRRATPEDFRSPSPLVPGRTGGEESRDGSLFGEGETEAFRDSPVLGGGSKA